MKSIAGYKIHKLLAKGGMAAIYLAEQESLQRTVVLKFLNPKLDEEIRKRFIDEGRIIASLKHPNILTVFDVVSSGKYNFLAMEYLDGGDLENRLAKGIDTYEALDIINKISDAMHLVHKQGIIHGDIKPANVLFRANGCPLLTDFGISRKIEPKKEVDTGLEDLYASPTYASPELIQGKPFDYRTDIYSLGIMMYEMLVGEKPFKGDSEMEIIANSIQDPIPKLPNNLKELQPLLESLLAKSPDDRLSDTKLVTRFISKYLKDHPEIKSSGSETKLIDSEVVVEYIAQQKSKKDKKASQSLMSTILLALIFTLILLLNKETLWNTWFAEEPVKKTPKAALKQIQTPISRQEKVEEKEELLKQQALIAQQNKEINRVKEELEKQKRLARKKQIDRLTTINSLLRKGDSSLKDYRLTTPLNNNALYYFQKVLEMDPKNKKAQEGIEKVVSRYEILARGEIDKYQYQKAQHYISSGLSIDSDNESLLELQKKANIQSEPGRAINKVKNFFNNL